MARFSISGGDFVGWSKLPNGVISFGQALARKAFGRYPRQPWIPFCARDAIDEILTPEFTVWEIGAGNSTLWLSDRVRKVTSIEAAKDWYDRLSQIILHEQIENVDLRYEWEEQRMADFSEVADHSLDLLFIDGGPRGLCLSRGFQKVKSGGYLYLDNWDTKHFWGEEANFLSAKKEYIAEHWSFIDYIPAQVGVYEGVLLKKA